MTREQAAYNRGVEDLCALAKASADALRAKLVKAPTRYGFALAALDALVEASASLTIPHDPPPASNAEASRT